MANYDALKTIIDDSKDWKAQHDAFGTHLAKNASAEYLSTVANTMIARYKTWTENWKTVLEGIKPELEEVRAKQLDATAEKFVGYTEEQLQALMDAIKQKKGLKDEVAPAALYIIRLGWATFGLPFFVPYCVQLYIVLIKLYLAQGKNKYKGKKKTYPELELEWLDGD